MIKYFLYIFCAATIITSCKNKNKQEGVKEYTKADTSAFIPAIELIKADADDVINIPYFLYIKTTDLQTNKVIDSAVLSKPNFKNIVAPLLQINLATKEARQKFNETTFQDLTTHSITSIISTNDAKENLKNITTLLDDERNQLKNSYITFESSSKDTSFTKKYSWKAHKSLTITTTTTVNKVVVKDIKQFINWNDKAE